MSNFDLYGAFLREAGLFENIDAETETTEFVESSKNIQDFKDRGSYFEYTERSTKTRTGETDDPKARRKYNNKIFKRDGSEGDPYLALKTYLSHRPEGIDEFYLQTIDSPKENIWYKRLPLKRDGLANIMKRMADTAEIQNEGKFTNTSGRKTAIQSLRGHFDPWQSRSSLATLTPVPSSPTAIIQYKHRGRCLTD
ncbi:hypothetical protein OS493_038941 [Desmophyllum pertusum]|uniref:DUF3504 domain-containing protein n=1 Tax=Desmophyllum pertusum TaxID=174260 RepID=A0A9W9ZKQ1_9CNID|nr:hypothetical protein OS493_038941 [Desmophyllum pertusum]